MVREGEAQPDNPEQQVLLEVQKSSKITCGSYLEEGQQDHVGSPMAAGARRAAREERERKRGEGNRVVRVWKYMDAPIYTKVHEIDFALFVHCMVFWWYFHFG